MRTWAVGWAAGAWYLQRAAVLPSSGTMLLVICLACGATTLGVCASLWWRLPSAQSRSYARVVCLMLGALLAGYDWAAYRAHERLSRSLPLDLEGRDVRISGRVAGLPTLGEDGVRFLFRVDKVLSPVPDGEDAAHFSENFASLLRLSWSSDSGFQPARRKPAAIPGVALTAGSANTAKPRVPRVVPGQRCTFTVRLKRPHANANFGGPDFEGWMLQRDIRATGYVRSSVCLPIGQRPLDQVEGRGAQLKEWAFDLRQCVERYRGKVGGRIESVLPQAAHQGVVKALTIGDQGAIAKSDWERFARTGTNHLVAISGLHVGLVAGLMAWLGRGLWRSTAHSRWALPLRVPAPRIAAVCGLISAGLFVALAGFGIPAQRAFWMLAAVFLTMISGRSAAPSSLWCMALFLVVTVDPWAPISAGFWLSFAAVGSILYALNAEGRQVQASDDTFDEPTSQGAYLPLKPLRGLARPPSSAFRRKIRSVWPSVKHGLASTTRAQFAVTIALIPATLGWFGQVPLLGPLANAFAIPWVSFLVVPAVLTGVIVPAPFDAYAFVIAHHLIAWLCVALDIFAAPQWALLRLPQPGMIATCAAVVGLAVWLGPRGLPLQRLAPLLCLPLLMPRTSGLAEGDYRVTMMDIGQGNAVLVETRQRRMLFDTGPPIGVSDAGERVILPALRAEGIHHLDALVVSHNHDDHYGGAASLLTQLPVRHFLASLPLRQTLWATAKNAGARTQRCQQGQSWQWNGVRFDVLWPPDPRVEAPANTMSCVIRISNGRHVALLSGDIEAAQEAALLQSGLPLAAHMLLVPHHGSRTSSTETFLKAVAPDHAVFQMGYLNRHRHPHPQVVARYTALGTQTYRSDQDGGVRFVSSAADDWLLRVAAYRRVHRRYWMGR